MSATEHATLLRSVTAKLAAGKPLDEAEKVHLAGCEACLRELVNHLDKAAPGKNGVGPSSATNATTSTHPEAERALHRARQVFLREFGIELSSEQRKETHSASA